MQERGLESLAYSDLSFLQSSLDPWSDTYLNLLRWKVCKLDALFAKCGLSLVGYQNGCKLNYCGPCYPTLMVPRDYYAALLRTHSGLVAPTQGQLLNYVSRIPLGVVVQITVSQHLACILWPS
jgi:hypothetical protein